MSVKEWKWEARSEARALQNNNLSNENIPMKTTINVSGFWNGGNWNDVTYDVISSEEEIKSAIPPANFRLNDKAREEWTK